MTNNLGQFIIFQGQNPYGSLPIDGVTTGCPVMTAMEPKYWGGRYQSFDYEVRPSHVKSYDADWLGAHVRTDAVRTDWHERHLYQVKRDKEVGEGVGLDDGIVKTLMKESHGAVLRGLLGALETGTLSSPSGYSDEYWHGENPVFTASAKWTDDGSPLADLDNVQHLQEVNDAETGIFLILSHEACEAFLKNEQVNKSSLWTTPDGPNGLTLCIPKAIQPYAETRRPTPTELWISRSEPKAVQSGECIASPWFEFKGRYNGLSIFRDRKGLLKHDGLLLPRLDANKNGYRAVFGASDVGGEILKGNQITIVKDTHRSGAVLSSYCSFGLALTDDNPYHAISLRGLI